MAIVGIGTVSLLFLILIIFGVVRSLKEKVRVEVEREPPPAEVARGSLSDLERDAMDNREETFAEAGKVIASYLSASSYKERLAFVRWPERVEPMMEAFYKENPDGPIEFREPEKGWQMQAYQSFLLSRVETKDYRYLPVAVERQENGEFKIDWESFVGYCEIPWDKITERRSTTPFMIRALLGIGDYYNYGFKEGEWACIRIQDPAAKHTFYGYVGFDEPVLEDLKGVMNPYSPTHLTVKVAYPEDGKASNQLRITEFIAKGWVYNLEEEEEKNGEEEKDGEDGEKQVEKDEEPTASP